MLLSLNRTSTLAAEAEGYTPAVLRVRADTLLAGGLLTLVLAEKVNQLSEVTVRSNLRTWYKGDTLVLNAAQAVQDPDATANDVLARLEGVTLFNGQLRVGNREISRVYIDGKEFFGGQLATILNTLRADMLNTIDVYAKIIDGQTVYVLDIRLNPARRQGYWGSTLLASTHTGRRIMGTATAQRLLSNGMLTGRLIFSPINDLYQRHLLTQNEVEEGDRLAGRPYSLANFVEQGRSGVQRFRQRFTDYFSESTGDNRLTTAQFGVSQTFSNQLNLTIRLTADSHRLNQWTDERQYIDLAAFRQRTQTLTQQINLPTQLNTLVRLDWPINERNTIRLITSRLYQSNRRQETGSQLNVVEDSTGQRQLPSQINRSADIQNNVGQWESLLRWTHRFSQPARLLSVAYQLSTDDQQQSQRYVNEAIPDVRQRLPRQLTQRTAELAYHQAGVVYAQPLWRRWLAEVGWLSNRDLYGLQQVGLGAVSADQPFTIPLPTLSLSNFRSIAHQHDVRLVLVHRTPLYRFVVGAMRSGTSYSRWLIDSSYHQQSTYLNPYLFAAWRPADYWELQVSFKQQQTFPDWFQLTPVADSTNLLVVSKGNPYLGFSNIRQVRGVVRWSSPSDKSIVFDLQHESIQWPVINTTRFEEASGYTLFSYVQGQHQLRWHSTLTYLHKLSESVSIFSYGMFTQETGPVLINNLTLPSTSRRITGLAQIKWAVSRSFTLEFDNTLNSQTQQTGKDPPTTNIINECKLSGRLSVQQRVQVNMQIVAVASQFTRSAWALQRPYVLMHGVVRLKKHWKANWLINNPFGTAQALTGYVSANRQVQTQIRQLPPFVQAGITYSFATWQ